MLFDPKRTRELGLGIGLSFQLVISVVLGLYLGMYIDEKFEIQPFGSLFCAIFGFALGVIPFITTFNKSNKTEN